MALVVFVGNYLTRPIFRFIALAQLRELFTAAALMFVIGIAVLMSLVGFAVAATFHYLVWGRVMTRIIEQEQAAENPELSDGEADGDAR